MYEESIRMPFLVRYPPAIKPGSINDAMILNVDFAPTFMELAGLPIPAEIQGRSIKSLLSGQTPETGAKAGITAITIIRATIRYSRITACARALQIELLHRLDQWELFDLKTDPRELKNIVNDPQNAKTVAD